MSTEDIKAMIEEFDAAVYGANLCAIRHNRYVNLTEVKAKRLQIPFDSTEAREQWIAALQRLDRQSGDIFAMFVKLGLDASAVFDFIQRARQIRESTGEDPLRVLPCFAAIHNLELHATKKPPKLSTRFTSWMTKADIADLMKCDPRSAAKKLGNSLESNTREKHRVNLDTCPPDLVHHFISSD